LITVCWRLIKGGKSMHLSDGVLNMPAVVTTTAVAGGMLINSFKDIKEEEIPRVSLMTATFFTFALISFPVGPSSVHPLLGGLIGIMLGMKSPIAIFIGLLLQAIIFQHGGLTTLGMNTIMVALPAILSYKIFSKLVEKKKSITLSAGLAGVSSVIMTVIILIMVLLLSSSAYGEGFLSVINILILGHLPLAIGEGILTAVVINFINKVRPDILKQYQTNI
jgi:cobalt/nickel transport system permease protein